MRIVILADAYLPHSTHNHANMLHQLGRKFVQQGHEVVVITPGGQQDKAMRQYELDGVHVWQFRSRPTRGISHIHRAINESLLSWFAFRAIKTMRLNPHFDLVVNYSPTIFFAPLVSWFRGKGAYVYLILRDIFPQWAIDKGLIRKGSLIHRYFDFVANWNYRLSNTIAVQSPANIPVFEQLTQGKAYPVDVLYNWVDMHNTVDRGFGQSLLERFQLEDKFIFFYGGNIGHAQDIPYILELASRLIAYPDIHFLLIGQGDQFDHIQTQITQRAMQNVTLLSSINQVQYRSVLSQVDVGIFTLAGTHTAHNFPGKILGYLTAKLPILGAVNPGNDIAQLLNDAMVGKVSVIGNVQAFLEDALSLYHAVKAHNIPQQAFTQLVNNVFSVDQAAMQILNSYDGKDSTPHLAEPTT